jgi:MFS family permease
MSDALQIAEKNIRRFIAFRALFNARFYYPIFAIIFLDFGLSLDQFAILNAIWALTIILAEVPSGALSDLIGRKKLMNATAALMVLELIVWAFAPLGDPDRLFIWLAINRILSGLAEAAASGADEALVYDSLKEAGIEDRWTHVLDLMTRWKSFAFVVAMVTGGVVYDPQLQQSFCALLGVEGHLNTTIALRMPLYLTLLSGIACCFVCSGMVDVRAQRHSLNKHPIKASLRQTLQAGRWILQTPVALAIILLGAFADGTIRMFITLASEYYRLIHYPEFALGIIGSVMGLINIGFSPLVRRWVERMQVTHIWIWVTVLGMGAFIGIERFIPFAGILFMLLLNVAFLLVSFLLSHYLNREASSDIRATVLSFKGLALNLSYGGIGLIYALSLNLLRQKEALVLSADGLFVLSSQWFLPFYSMGMVLLLIGAYRALKGKN